MCSAARSRRSSCCIFAGRLLVLALQRVRGGVGVAWRYGIANVARRGRESSVQVVAFGIGLMVLLLLDVGAHGAHDAMAGDAAGKRAEPLPH